MRIYHQRFFQEVRSALFNGTIKDQKTVDTISYMLEYWEVMHNDLPLEFLAYCFATAYHETEFVLFPNKEKGGNGYLTKMYDVSGSRRSIAIRYGNTNVGDGVLYSGKGLAHITWKSNYARLGRKLGIPLVETPELALQIDVAVMILIEGMIDGEFRKHKLADYWDGANFDAVGARQIINGDRNGQAISKYYTKFLRSLQAAATNERGIDYDLKRDRTTSVAPPKENSMPQPQPQQMQPLPTPPRQRPYQHRVQNAPQFDGFYEEPTPFEDGNGYPMGYQYPQQSINISPDDYASFMKYKYDMANSKPMIHSSTIKVAATTAVSLMVAYFGIDKFIPPEMAVEIITGVAGIGLTIITAIRTTEKTPKIIRGVM